MLAAIVLNVALLVVTALVAVSWLPTFSSYLTQREPSPSPTEDWSENRLTDYLREELNSASCTIAQGLIRDSASAEAVSDALDEIGLDIYLARDALLELDPPEIGFVAALTEQVELEASSVLEAVISAYPDFEDSLSFELMLSRATRELVDFCNLEQSLGQAIGVQQKADSALKTLRELAAESAWYPRGFNRISRNLAWGWTSESGAAPCENCVYWKVTLVARDGCLGGAIVEIRVFEGEAELIALRETWTRLREGQSVTAEFPYRQLNPDLTAQVSIAECFAHEQP